jgi:hypothetical protein
MPSPRDVLRKYGPIVHTCVVSGRSPVRNAVRLGLQTAMETCAFWNWTPDAASLARLGAWTGPPYEAITGAKSSTTMKRTDVRTFVWFARAAMSVVMRQAARI